MKLIILVACALVAIAAAAPASPEPPKILVYRNEPQPNGGFISIFETEDGVRREEIGEIREVVNEEGELQKVLIIRGSFSYRDPEGNIQTIEYVADEAGFRAQGEGIPKAPVARR